MTGGALADASDASRVVAERAKGRLDGIVDSAHGLLNDAGLDKLTYVAAAGERVAVHGRQRLGQGVRKQPVEALLLAGAIGYLVGWAASRG